MVPTRRVVGDGLHYSVGAGVGKLLPFPRHSRKSKESDYEEETTESEWSEEEASV